MAARVAGGIPATFHRRSHRFERNVVMVSTEEPFELAREQKVDLAKISILQLADQYLAFISAARQMRLEIAADYLVMAAWLAYLKSRLLLPEPQPEDEPSGADMAAALAFQLQRLEAMQQAGLRLMARPLLGRDVFPRGVPEGLPLVSR